MSDFLQQNDRYTKEALRIINIIKSEFILDSGLLAMGRDAKNHLIQKNALPDIGDFVPFFLYFGESDFITHQITLAKDSLNNGILVSEFSTFKLNGLAKSYEYSDWLLGLLDYYDFNPTEDNKLFVRKNIDQAIKIFKFNSKHYSFYYPRLRINLPLRDSRDAMMIELFIEYYQLTQEKKYLDVAKNIFDKLINLDFYKKYGILPTFSGPNFLKLFSAKLQQGEICKANTNALFAFLSLWQETKDENILGHIDNMVTAILTQSYPDKGGIIKDYLPQTKSTKAFLTSSFAMLDFLCDFYHVSNQSQYLDKAKEIADYWLSLQSDTTGLFPLYNDKKEDFLDSETDMSVALFKLYEKTSDQRYAVAADKCLDGILKFHSPHDYAIGVDVDTGSLVNGGRKSKFLALFLKLLILKIEYAKNNRIYTDKKLFNLLRDR